MNNQVWLSVEQNRTGRWDESFLACFKYLGNNLTVAISRSLVVAVVKFWNWWMC